MIALPSPILAGLHGPARKREDYTSAPVLSASGLARPILEQPARVDDSWFRVIVVKASRYKSALVAGRCIGAGKKDGVLPGLFINAATLPAISFEPRATPRAAGVGGLLALLPGMISGAFKFFPALTASGSRIPGVTRIKALQKSERVVANPAHFHSLSASTGGLVASVERHDSSERKIPNGGRSGARPGNLTARSRNVSS